MNNQSLHILVVDVDSTSFLLLKIALEEVRKTEVALTHATRLDEALRCLHDNHFDAVLLHLNLPDSQGLETFVTMQREHPALPILILSGRDDEDTAIQAVQCGAQDFVAKGHIAGIPLVRSIRYAMERKRAEQRLIASEAGYRRLFETAHDGIFILDAASGQITDANPYLEEMLGYTISEFIGKRLWEIAPFRDKAANQAAFRTLQEKSYIRYDDLPLLTKDGKRANVEFISNVYEVGNQRVIQCNIRDITQRKQAEAAELESKRFLQSTLDALSSHIAVLDESGQIIAVNRTWRKFSEENQATAVSSGVGANYLAVCERARGIWSEEALAVAQGIREVMAGEHEAFCVEYPCHSPSEERWFNVCVTRFAGEGPIRVAVAHENITERKQAEETLRTSEELNRSIFESSTDCIKMLDMDENVLTMNGPGKLLMEIDDFSKVAGQCWIEFWKGDAKYLARAALDAAKAGGSGRFQGACPTFKGTPKWWDVSVTPLFGKQGQVVRLVSMSRDISDLKQAEIVLQEQAQISELSFDAVLVWTWNGAITFWNAGAESLYGFPREEAIGRVSHELLKTVHPQGKEDFLRLLETEGQCEAEVLHTKSNGQQIVVETRHKLIRDGGRTYVIETNRDITERRQIEIAMRRSESLFRALVQNSWNGFQLVQPDGQITYESPASARLLGYSAEEMEGHNALEFMHPDDAQEVMEGGQTLLESPGNTRTVILRIRHKDGSWRWMESYEINLLDHPDVGAIAVNYHDITERKAAEEALLQAKEYLELKVIERTSELSAMNDHLQSEIIERQNADSNLYKNHEFLEAVLENTTEGIVACDAEGQLSFFNRATRDFHGLPLEPLPPAQWSQYYSLFMPDGVTPMLTEEVPLFKTLNGEPSRDAEMVIAPNEGTPRLLIANGELLFDADGAKLGAVVVMHDVTQRKQAEVELQRSRQELQNLIDAMTTMAAKIAPDGTFLISNKIAIDGSGLSHEEYMKTNFLSGPWWAFDPEVQQRVGEKFQQALAGTPINYEEKTFVFGETRTINFSLIPMRNGGNKVDHIVAEGRDITELKHTETALQTAKAEADRANLAKSEFLSRMSHELRTPLNAILGFGQILEKEDLDPLSQESVGYILKGGRHLLDLINEVLDIARVEAGHADLSLEPIALDEVLIDACSLVRPLAAERNIRLLGNTSEIGGIHVLADRQRFKQVLINLLSNAIKYNREGGQVEIACEAKPDGRMAIAVCDTGPGIAAQDLTKLFTPFERLNAGASDVEGTGLGLVLSQRLVTAMGGTLTVESVLGRGTTFTIELPQAVSPVQQADLPESRAPVQTKRESERTYSILCIEDNASNLRLIEVVLRSRPEIALLSAIQGSVGLDLARQHEPDLILLDLNLPDIHGSEVLTRLQQSALTRDIPVVVISADATSKQIEKLIAAGARDYLTKPLDVEQFLSTLDKFLHEVPATEI